MNLEFFILIFLKIKMSRQELLRSDETQEFGITERSSNPNETVMRSTELFQVSAQKSSDMTRGNHAQSEIQIEVKNEISTEGLRKSLISITKQPN